MDRQAGTHHTHAHMLHTPLTVPSQTQLSGSVVKNTKFGAIIMSQGKFSEHESSSEYLRYFMLIYTLTLSSYDEIVKYFVLVFFVSAIYSAVAIKNIKM